MFFTRFIALSLGLMFYSRSAQAADGCYDIIEKFKLIIKDFAPSSVMALTLRVNREARYMVFIGRNQTNIPNHVPWLIARRGSEDDPSKYCTEGQGTTMETLAAFPKANERFGLPGSGYPRCTEENDPLGGPEDSRVGE